MVVKDLKYMVVMSYAKEGTLRKCLSNIVKRNWQGRLQLLKKIILGLKTIHESNLAHCDLHDGNILISENYLELFIIDLGLCKYIDTNSPQSNNYGVLPYIAPEVLRNKPYTLASDIYSFSMIMWEFTSGIPPFNDKVHDFQLSLGICKGERPEIIKNTPQCYVDLMEKCWDSDPLKRPNVITLENTISKWIRCINKYYEMKDKNDEVLIYQVPDIDNQLHDIREFVEAVEANKLALPGVSEELNKSLVQKDATNSDCLDCKIDGNFC